MTRKLIPLLACLLLLPAAGEAADLYLGGGLGSKVEAGVYSEPLSRFGVEAENAGRKVFAGANLAERWGIEATYYDFGRRNCCPQLADAGFTTKLDGVSLAAVGRLPRQRFELFAKAGVLAWQEDGEDISIAGPSPLAADGTDPLLGVGVLWKVVGKLSLGAEFEAFKLGGDSAEALWLTARIGF